MAIFRATGDGMSIHEEFEDGVMGVLMDNPPVNALNTTDAWKLVELLDGCNSRPEVKAVVLSAVGHGFSAGVDIVEIQEAPGNEGILEANRSCAELFRAVHQCPIPVVAAVNGHCLGSGVGLAGSADVIVATEGSTFGLPEVDNGALGAATHLARLVPAQRARWMLYSCELASAEELLGYGSVMKVVPLEQLALVAREMALKIATKDPTVIRAAKASLNAIEAIDMTTSYRLEQSYTYELNLLGLGDRARRAFLSGERNRSSNEE